MAGSFILTVLCLPCHTILMIVSTHSSQKFVLLFSFDLQYPEATFNFYSTSILFLRHWTKPNCFRLANRIIKNSFYCSWIKIHFGKRMNLFSRTSFHFFFFFRTCAKLISQDLTISARFLKLCAHSGKTQCSDSHRHVGRIIEFNLYQESITDLLQGPSNIIAEIYNKYQNSLLLFDFLHVQWHQHKVRYLRRNWGSTFFVDTVSHPFSLELTFRQIED